LPDIGRVTVVDKSDEISDLRKEVKRLKGRPGPNAPETVYAKCRLADLLYQANELDESQKLYREVLHNWRTQRADDRLLLADVTGHLASVLSRLGRYDEALAHHQEVIDLLDGYSSGPSDPTALQAATLMAVAMLDVRPAFPVASFNVWYGLARALAAQPESTGAVEATLRALAVIERAGAATTGGEQHRDRFHAAFGCAYDLLVGLSVAAGEEDSRTALFYAEKNRNRTLIHLLQLSGIDLWVTLPEPVRERLVACKDALIQRQTQLTSEILADRNVYDNVIELKSVERSRLMLQNEFHDASPLLRRLLGKSMAPGQFQASLASLHADFAGSGTTLLYYYLGNTQSYLFVLSANGQMLCRKLAISAESAPEVTVNHESHPIPFTRPLADQMVQRYVAHIRRQKGKEVRFGSPVSMKDLIDGPASITVGSSVVTLKPFKVDEAYTLTDVLLPRDIRGLIADSKRVIIVPGGALHHLPFQALPVRNRSAGEAFDSPTGW